MTQSRAHRDRENVAESLRRFGFGEAGIEAMLAMEAKIQEEKNRKPEVIDQPTLF